MNPLLPTEVTDPRQRILYSPIESRPKIEWPNGAKVAFWVSPNVEHYEYQPPANQPFSIFGRVPTPDVQQYGLRDYGNRVGFWRMTELFDEYGLKATVSTNLAVLDHYPDITKAMIDREWELMSHGIYNTRVIYHLDEAEELEFIQDNLDTHLRHTGRPLQGMLGPALSSTMRSPDLLAEAGLFYQADWPIDDQPVPVLVRGGQKIVSVPYSYDLNDGNPAFGNDQQLLAEHSIAHFDQLMKVGAESGQVMCVALHPFSIGQAHSIGYLREIFEHICGRDDVWYTTADQIARYYIDNYYDAYIEHAVALRK